jgi:inhibitor of KinA
MLHFGALGDRAVMITLGDSIDEATHARVRAACARIAQLAHPAITELVPAYASVAVHYDPLQVLGVMDGRSPHEAIVDTLRGPLTDLRPARADAAVTHEIPVCYGGELGPDLDDVARQHSLTSDEVIARHAERDYLVYMVGFVPGFAYLGGLAPELATPRRSEPRTRVPAGTVGIGGSQTGVYPMVSPGGWNLIGQTPARMFDPAREPATLLAMGDRVRFRSIDRQTFDTLSASR